MGSDVAIACLVCMNALVAACASYDVCLLAKAMIHSHPHLREERIGATDLPSCAVCVRLGPAGVPFCRWQDAKRAFSGDNAVHLTVPQGLRVHASQPLNQVRILRWLLLLS